jgi:hypothetical protein
MRLRMVSLCQCCPRNRGEEVAAACDLSYNNPSAVISFAAPFVKPWMTSDSRALLSL